MSPITDLRLPCEYVRAAVRNLLERQRADVACTSNQYSTFLHRLLYHSLEVFLLFGVVAMMFRTLLGLAALSFSAQALSGTSQHTVYHTAKPPAGPGWTSGKGAQLPVQPSIPAEASEPGMRLRFRETKALQPLSYSSLPYPPCFALNGIISTTQASNKISPTPSMPMAPIFHAKFMSRRKSGNIIQMIFIRPD